MILEEARKMKRAISMYPVGFGDCYLIEDDKSALLVDFGNINSQSPIHNFGNTTSALQKAIQNKEERSLLVTHFHRDHYNLINSLQSNLFAKIYLRNIYSNQQTFTVSLWLLLVALFSTNPAVTFDEALYRIVAVDRLGTMLTNNGFFVFVKQGSTFTSGATTYEVLSPWRRRLPFSLFRQDIQTISDAVNVADEIRIIEHYQQTIKNEIENQSPERFFHEKNDEVQKVERAGNEIKNKFEKMTREEKEKIVHQLAANPMKAANFEHLYNIVFRSSDKKLLMCGDESASDMAKIMTKFYRDGDSIHIIKLPHHGTKTHYYPFCTYRPDIGLISNENTAYGGKPYCFYQRDFSSLYDTYGNMDYIHPNACRFSQVYCPGCNATSFSVLNFSF
jgi:beta-lactamase superfamily II metal-dependent hydrolase